MQSGMFSQKGKDFTGALRGEAVDVEPREQSGAFAAKLGKPVWRQFVANKDFQESQAGAIQAERDYQGRVERGNDDIRRQQEKDAKAAAAEKWGGDNGRLFRQTAAGVEQFDAEEFAEDERVGGYARKSLFDRELRGIKEDVKMRKLRLSDPNDRRALSDRERKEIEEDISIFSTQTDAESQALLKERKARLAKADERLADEKAAFDAEMKAMEYGNLTPDDWYSTNGKKSLEEKRQAALAADDARAREVMAADESAAAEMREIDAKLAQGVRGSEVEGLKAQRAELAAGRVSIAQERNNLGAGREAVRGEAVGEIAREKKAVQATAREALAAKMEKAGIFGSATSAMGQAVDKSIRRNADGSWDLPFLMQSPDNAVVRTVGGLAQTVAQKTGARLDSAGVGVDKEAIQKVFYDFQKENNLSDDEVVSAWNDLGNINRKWEKEEPARVLSDGTLLPNYSNSGWLDDEAARRMIAESKASPESKAAAEANLPEIQRVIAKEKALGYQAAAAMRVFGVKGEVPLITDYLKKNEGMPLPEAIRNFEAQYITPRGDIQKKVDEYNASLKMGWLKVVNTILGLAGVAGADKAGRHGAEISTLSGYLGAGAGSDGLVNSIIQEAPSIGVQIALTRGIGGLAGAVSGSAKVAQAAGTLGALTTAGGQSAGATFTAELANGATEEEARKKALYSGVNTAIITGIFQKLGAGGVEKVAAGGSVGDITMRQLLASASKKEIFDNTRKMVAGIAKSAGGEGLEEGLDELTQAFLTADPDTNLADAWNNAVKAAKVGAAIGGAVDVAQKVVGRETPAADPLSRLNTRIVADDPGHDPASEPEVARAVEFVQDPDNVDDVADAVLAAREIDVVEFAEDEAMGAAEAAVLEAQSSGDPQAVKAAEGNLEAVRKTTGKAVRARAVLKLTSGGGMADLTDAEARSIGFDISGAEPKPLKGKDLEAQGLTKPLVRPGADGSPIVLDEALKGLEAVSPRARARVRMTESQAIRAAAKAAAASAAPAGSAPSTPAPSNPSAPRRFTVGLRSGATMEVEAMDEAGAEQEAAASIPAGSDSIVPGSAVAVDPPVNGQNQGQIPAANPAQSQQQGKDKDKTSDTAAPPLSPEGLKGRSNFDLQAEEFRLKAILRENVTDPEGQENAKLAQEALDNVRAEITRRKADTAAPPANPKETGAKAKARVRKYAEDLKKGNPRLANLRLTEDPSIRAQANLDGSVDINLSLLVDQAMAAGMNEGQAAKFAARALDEEIRHMAQYAASRKLYETSGSDLPYEAWRAEYYGGIWQNDFLATPAKAQAVAKLYGKEGKGIADFNGMEDWRKAFEAIRMMSQGRKSTEAATLWANISTQLRAALEAALEAMKTLVANPSPTLRAEIAALEEALAQIKSNEQGTGNTDVDSKKPAQGKKADGNGGKTKTGSGRPTGDGGTAGKTPSGAPAGAIAPGTRVIVTHPEGELPGVVQLVRSDGQVVKVRLDAPLKDGRDNLALPIQSVTPVVVGKTKLDLMLDTVERTGEELTIELTDANRDSLNRIVAAAEARGLSAAQYGNSVLIRKIEQDAPPTAQLEEEKGEPEAEEKAPTPYNDLLRAITAGEEAARSFDNLTPTIQMNTEGFHATGDPRTKKAIVTYLAGRGVTGNVGTLVDAILKNLPLVDRMEARQEAIRELNERDRKPGKAPKPTGPQIGQNPGQKPAKPKQPKAKAADKKKAQAAKDEAEAKIHALGWMTGSVGSINPRSYAVLGRQHTPDFPGEQNWEAVLGWIEANATKAKKPRARRAVSFKMSQVMKIFQDNPVVAQIISQGGIMSATRARKEMGEAWWKLNKSLYDDAPTFANPTFNAIYSRRSLLTPDEITQALAGEGIIQDDVTQLWAEVSKAANSATKINKETMQEAVRQNEDLEKLVAFENANQERAEGVMGIQAGDMVEGDVVIIGGELFTFESNNGDVVILKDGEKFGTQRIAVENVLWAEVDTESDFLSQDEIEEKGEELVDEAERKGYESVDELIESEPGSIEAKIEGSPQEGDPDGGTGGGSPPQSPKGQVKVPASKMDIRNADSKELFADDGGFRLGQDSTQDGDKIDAERKAKEEAQAAMDAAQGDLFAGPLPQRSLKEIREDMKAYPGASYNPAKLPRVGPAYSSFRLRDEGVTLYVRSNTGALFPDGHEILLTGQAPREIPRGGGAFWNRLRDGGRRNAILDAIRQSGEGSAEFRALAKVFLKSEGSQRTGSVADTWDWILGTLNSPALEGMDMEVIADQLPVIFGLDGVVSEEMARDSYLYIPLDEAGTVLALDQDSQQWSFGRKPTKQELAEAREAHEADPGGFPLYAGGLPAAPFYSHLERTVEAKIPARATPEQIMATARAAGVKAEEIKWSGIEQALGSLAVDGKVPKDALLAYLRDEGAVRFEEVSSEGETEMKWKNDDGYSVELLTHDEMQEVLEKEAQSIRDSFDINNEVTPIDSDGDETTEGNEDNPPVKWRVNLTDGSNEDFDSKKEAEARMEEELDWIENDAAKIGESSVSDWEGNTVVSFSEEAVTSEGSTKFGQYVLPGGENYREVVLAMPEKSDTAPSLTDWMKSKGYPESEKPIRAGEYQREFPPRDKTSYTSSHFPDVPNYVAHMRTNERDGGLFIEEIQSDRHQAGRKEGYWEAGKTKTLFTPWYEYGEAKTRRDGSFRKSRSIGTTYDTRSEAEQWLQLHADKTTGIDESVVEDRKGAAPAPFQTTWPLAMFKRALRDAVESGKGWIGWTTGETQNDRFNLSKSISEIAYWKEDDGYGIGALDLDGNSVIDQGFAKDEQALEAMIGKELAQKIINDEGGDGQDYESRYLNRRTGKLEDGVKVFTGDDLKVGGSGMKGFYDNMLPKEIGKYVKQWGGKVERSMIPESGVAGALHVVRDESGEVIASFKDRAKAEAYASEKSGRVLDTKTGSNIWRVEITPEMREGVTGGQALFAAGLPAPLPALRANSPEWKAMSKEERMDYLRRKKVAKMPLEKSIGQRENESIESPSNVFGTKWQEIPESELAPWQKLAVTNANRSTGRQSDLRAVRPSEKTKGAVLSGRFTEELFRVFRKRVGLVGSFNGNPPNFDGAVHPDDTNTVIIDADATSGWTYLLGHELGHSIQHQQPELYDGLKKTLLGMAKDWRGYREKLSQTYDTKAKQDAEFVNDFIGSQFGDPDFWKELKARDKTTFGKLVSFAVRYLKSIGGRIQSMSRDVRPYFDDIESARSELLKTLEAYQRGEMPDQSVRKPELEDTSDDDLTSPLNVAPLTPGAESEANVTRLRMEGRRRINQPMAEEERKQQELFREDGKVVGAPRLANPGDTDRSRGEQDIVDALYEHDRTVREDRSVIVEARRRMEEDPRGVEEKLLQAAYGDGMVRMDDSDHVAARLLINQRAAEAGNDLAKHEANMALRMAYRMIRADTARELRIGRDLYKTPEERALEYITDAIYQPTLRVEKKLREENWSPQKKREYVRAEAKARLAQIEKALKGMGVTLDEITSGQAFLSLSQEQILKASLALRTAEEQYVIKLIQKKWPLSRIRKATGFPDARIQEINAKLYAELMEKAREKARAGVRLENYRDKPAGMQAAPLNAAPVMSEEEIEAEARRIVEVGFGISPTVAEKAVTKRKVEKKTKEEKEAEKADRNTLTANWSRPVFTDGLNSFEFDTKDRAEIMQRAQAIRDIAAATGKISTLTGANKAKAIKLLAELNAILGKYGTDANRIFESGKPVDDYRFDIRDRAHVAAVARAIRAVDADVLDKGIEWTYSAILGGLQTMIVNAGAAIPAGWDMTMGRAFEASLNLVFQDPMAASFGEAKYILKAAGPTLARAWGNAVATWGAELPMFDEDFLGRPTDIDKLFDGKAPKMGVISGKKGRIIRIPTRMLMATDDFNRTAIAVMEVGAMAYRLARAQGMKPGTPEFDRFLKIQVNMPGSFAAKLAAEKASHLIFTNALPGQKGAVDNKTVPIEGLGDIVGAGAAALNRFVTMEVDSLLAKSALAFMRLAFVPFQRTPFNLIRRGVRHTLNPISLLDIAFLTAKNSFSKDAATGKWGFRWNADGRQAEIIERSSQQLQGGMLMLLLYALAAGDGDDDDLEKLFLVTGTQPWQPKKKAELAANRRLGIGAYRISFRTKNGKERFGFNYGRIEPLGTTLGLTVDSLANLKKAMRGGKGYGEAALSVFGGTLASAQEKTYLAGLSDFFNLAMDSVADDEFKMDARLQQFAASRVGMVIPNFIKQPIRETDPYYRDKAGNFIEDLFYQVAPAAGMKEEKITPYGEKEKKTGTSLGRVFDVTDSGTSEVNPYDEMFLRYESKNPGEGWFPGDARNTYTDPRTGEKNVKMTPGQTKMFRETAGKRATALLKREALNLDNPTERDKDKGKAAFERARADAKKLLLRNPKWLTAE